MVKKLQRMAEKQAASPSGLLDSHLAQTVKDSAQQIWLAGLGAFAKAQGEGGKVFDTLMREGASLQRKTQSAAGEKLGDVAGKMSAMAGEVGSKANAHWDKLESIFEERTARAMSKLGVPNAKALSALVDRVAALEAQLAASKAKSAPAAALRFKPGKDLKPAVAAKPAARSARKPAAKAAAEAATAKAPAAKAPAVKRASKRKTSGAAG